MQVRLFVKKSLVFGLAVILTFGLYLSSASAEKMKKDDSKKEEAKVVTTDTGLAYVDEIVGQGDEAISGKKVAVHYTGWLDQSGEKGSKFDSSVDRGQPFQFILGKGMVIKGWDQGVKGMKIGGKRTLLIPSDLAYGQRGAGNTIPPNAKLIFDVELLKVE